MNSKTLVRRRLWPRGKGGGYHVCLVGFPCKRLNDCLNVYFCVGATCADVQTVKFLCGGFALVCMFGCTCVVCKQVCIRAESFLQHVAVTVSLLNIRLCIL